MTDNERAAKARNATDLRYPKTVEEALRDNVDAITHDNVAIIFTNELMLEILQLLAKIKHS